MIHAASSQAGFDRVFISATPGDEGIALGCATCAAVVILTRVRRTNCT